MKATSNKVKDTYSAVTGRTIPLDEIHLSITVTDFKDEKEQGILLAKIKDAIKSMNARVKIH